MSHLSCFQLLAAQTSKLQSFQSGSGLPSKQEYALSPTDMHPQVMLNSFLNKCKYFCSIRRCNVLHSLSLFPCNGFRNWD